MKILNIDNTKEVVYKNVKELVGRNEQLFENNILNKEFIQNEKILKLENIQNKIKDKINDTKSKKEQYRNKNEQMINKIKKVISNKF
jgi:Ser-tRNA(Ala) deacylase AlaX